MRALLSVLVVSAALFAGTGQPAQAHTKYAGHTCKYWSVTSPTSGTTIRYRECLRDQWACSNHSHLYVTEYLRYTIINGWFWHDVHQHIRIYACHAV